MTGGVKQDRGTLQILQVSAEEQVLTAASLMVPRLACTRKLFHDLGEKQSATLLFTNHRLSIFSCEPHGTCLGRIPPTSLLTAPLPQALLRSPARGAGGQEGRAEGS